MSNGVWKRPVPARLEPKRGVGGYYRTADVPGQGDGVPLSSANDALVAAVRLAYRVAEAQVDRSTRMAQRLRDAGDRVTGGDSPRKAMDATEQLVMKTMMSALEWWESSVAQGRCPVKRVAAAEYRMVGQILGFDAPRAKATDVEDEGEEGEARSVRGGDAPAAERPAPRLRVRLEGQRRPVRILHWELAAGTIDPQLQFFHAEGATLEAELLVRARSVPILVMHFPAARKGAAPSPRGTWSAAICAPDGEQLGFIEIAL
jgi:hypothetical protein